MRLGFSTMPLFPMSSDMEGPGLLAILPLLRTLSYQSYYRRPRKARLKVLAFQGAFRALSLTLLDDRVPLHLP